jgi:hypothetical protein
MRIAIAESQGLGKWVLLQCWCKNENGKLIARPSGPPNYPADLNAIMPILPPGYTHKCWQVEKHGKQIGINHHLSQGLYAFAEGPDLALVACEFYCKVNHLWTNATQETKA